MTVVGGIPNSHHAGSACDRQKLAIGRIGDGPVVSAVRGQRRSQFAGCTVINSDLGIETADGELRAVGTKDNFSSATHRGLKSLKQRTVGRIPQPDLPILPNGRQRGAVRTESQAANPVIMLLKRGLHFFRADIPEPDPVIVATDGQKLAGAVQIDARNDRHRIIRANSVKQTEAFRWLLHSLGRCRTGKTQEQNRE